MTHTEIDISAEFVRDLLRDQHPDLADRPVRLGDYTRTLKKRVKHMHELGLSDGDIGELLGLTK
ncbi:hypothetical protein AB0J43_31855, partial [Nonomuraea fuscirosea]